MSIELGSTGADRRLKRPEPLRESVYEALTEMIIGGSLQPGQHLVEVQLAGMLGVSRQPIREALQRLRNEGWVDMRPGFGATVHIPDEDEVDQLLARPGRPGERVRPTGRRPNHRGSDQDPPERLSGGVQPSQERRHRRRGPSQRRVPPARL